MNDLIRDGFSKDVDLINHWHIEAGNGLDACVQRTCDDLKNVHDSFTFFEYKENDIVIGFFGREFDNYINTVFVMPEYRTKEYMSRFWGFLTSKVTPKFYTALYSKNTRAINFYLNNGGTVCNTLKINSNDITLIEVNICHSPQER